MGGWFCGFWWGFWVFGFWGVFRGGRGGVLLGVCWGFVGGFVGFVVLFFFWGGVAGFAGFYKPLNLPLNFTMEALGCSPLYQQPFTGTIEQGGTY